MVNAFSGFPRCYFFKFVLSLVSRALWFNNLTLAARLIRFSPIAHDHIFIDNGLVCAHSYESFENTFLRFSGSTTDLKWLGYKQTLQRLLHRLLRSKSNHDFNAPAECKVISGQLVEGCGLQVLKHWMALLFLALNLCKRN